MPESDEQIKVLAYVTRAESLLVFRHTEHPEAGIQVPGGTVELGEDPLVAVAREAREETGLATFEEPALLGSDRLVASPRTGGRDVVRRFYHLKLEGQTPDRWRHWETDRSDGGSPVEFELFWADLPAGVPPLSGRQDAFLSALVARLIGRSGAGGAFAQP